MKKIIICISAVLLLNTGSYAQETSFGIKAGANLANLTGDVEDTKMLFGAYGGAFAHIGISETFGIQPEVLFSMEGAKSSGEDLALSYINIPVMLKYSNPSGFFAELGPQIGILTSAKLKLDGGSVDFKDYLKSTNFVLGIGAGYNVTPQIGVGARYNLGLSNISDDSEGELKTSVISFGLHYNFGK